MIARTALLIAVQLKPCRTRCCTHRHSLPRHVMAPCPIAGCPQLPAGSSSDCCPSSLHTYCIIRPQAPRFNGQPKENLASGPPLHSLPVIATIRPPWNSSTALSWLSDHFVTCRVSILLSQRTATHPFSTQSIVFNWETASSPQSRTSSLNPMHDTLYISAEVRSYDLAVEQM